MAAERLHADHRADDVAIDVDVAGGEPCADQLGGRIDARMRAPGQGVARRVERVDQLGERFALVAQHMQHGAEHLAARSATESISISVGAMKKPCAQASLSGSAWTGKPRARIAAT